MFPVAPDNTPHNAPADRPVNEGSDDTRDETSPSQGSSPNRTDAFQVPKPAPDKPKPEDVKVEPATDDTFTHYVHLADGRVLKADLSNLTEHIGSRYFENRGEDNETSVLITGVYAR